MSGGSWSIRVSHIVESIERANAFCEGMTCSEFKGDLRTAYAVVTCFAIIGEAASKIPMAVRKEHPQIPWEVMYRMRNVLVHDYDQVDLQIVWNTLHLDFPVVLPQLRALLGDRE